MRATRVWGEAVTRTRSASGPGVTAYEAACATITASPRARRLLDRSHGSMRGHRRCSAPHRFEPEGWGRAAAAKRYRIEYTGDKRLPSLFIRDILGADASFCCHTSDNLVVDVGETKAPGNESGRALRLPRPLHARCTRLCKPRARRYEPGAMASSAGGLCRASLRRGLRRVDLFMRWSGPGSNRPPS